MSQPLRTLRQSVGASTLIILIGLGAWSIPLIIAMTVAVFMVHGDDVFAKKELALLYLIGYVVILFTGSGRFAINRLSFN